MKTKPKAPWYVDPGISRTTRTYLKPGAYIDDKAITFKSTFSNPFLPTDLTGTRASDNVAYCHQCETIWDVPGAGHCIDCDAGLIYTTFGNPIFQKPNWMIKRIVCPQDGPLTQADLVYRCAHPAADPRIVCCSCSSPIEINFAVIANVPLGTSPIQRQWICTKCGQHYTGDPLPLLCPALSCSGHLVPYP